MTSADEISKGITVLGKARARVGESVVWHPLQDRVLSVDIWGCCVWSTDPVSGSQDLYPTAEMAAAILPTYAGAVVALESHLLSGQLGGVMIRIEAPATHFETHRFNDACVDPDGRMVIGTMRKSQLGLEPTGQLYRWSEGEWELLDAGFWTINGLAFSPNGRWLYYSDSHPSVQRVWRRAYGPSSRDLGPRELFIDFETLAGRPDGAAVDRDGRYWIAGVGGGCIYSFEPSGRLSRVIELPVELPTKVAFGGREGDRLFVSTMREKLTSPDPHGFAGAILAVQPDAIGTRQPLARLGHNLEGGSL